MDGFTTRTERYSKRRGRCEIRLKMIKGGCVVFRLHKNCGGDVDSSKPNTDSARLHDRMADPAAG
jgi:hypothetical protein